MALVLEIRAENKQAVQQIRQVARKAGASIREVGEQSERAGKRTSRAFAAATSAVARFAGPVGIGLALFGIKNLISSTIDVGDKIGKMSKATGLSAEFLSGMAFAAERSGTSLQGLDRGLRGLLRRMQDVKDGSIEGRRAFEQLGIQATDTEGNLRDAETVFLEIADRMRGMANETDKAALAQEIFGRAGLDLIPLLNEGSEGMQRLMNRARELGIVIDQETAQKMERAKDAMTDFNTAMRGFGQTLAIGVIPALTEFVEGLNQTITLTAEEKTRGFFAAMKSFALSMIKGEGAMGATAAAASVATAEVGVMRAETDKVAKKAEEIKTSMVRVEAATNRDSKAVLQLSQSAGRVRDVFDDTEGTVRRMGTVDVPQVATVLETKVSPTMLALRYNAEGMAFAVSTVLFDGLKRSIGKANELSDIMKEVGEQLVKMAALFAIKAGIQAIFKIQPGSTIGRFLTGLFGFQRGGSFVVPGVGGTDNRLVMFRASPGEQVTVTPNNTVNNFGGNFNINITAASVDQRFVETRLVPMLRKAARRGVL